ncbi:hypothetical protein [Euzebya pacifica]|uniref:hypothetical protein n=1 Tax=Euzebya pacifica TaxID=1608957 RepID=UPI0030F7302D
MSDLAEWMRGRPAWEPTDDSSLIAVFHKHDLPLAGLFEQHGCIYGFACIYGETAVHQFYAVAAITESERDDLEAAPSTDRARVLAEMIRAGHKVRVFLHDEYKGIVEGLDVEPGSSGDLVALTVDRLTDLVDELDRFAAASPLLAATC